MTNWTQAEAVALCTAIEEIAPRFGCHVALSGGCLYKRGVRKDCDVVLYRIRQQPEIDLTGLFTELESALGVKRGETHGYIFKAEYQGKKIDFMVPEQPDASTKDGKSGSVDE